MTAQLKQLAGAHEQQTGKLRQETDARRNADDELAAIRAGLQVGCPLSAVIKDWGAE